MCVNANLNIPSPVCFNDAHRFSRSNVSNMFRVRNKVFLLAVMVFYVCISAVIRLFTN